MNIFVFRTTLNTEEDVLSVAPVLNEHKQILKWSVDLEDSESNIFCHLPCTSYHGLLG